MEKQSKIILNLDGDSSQYTIASVEKVKAKYIRQTSSMDCFAVVDLEIKPYTDKKIAVFNNQILEINLGNTILYPQQNCDRDIISILDTISQGIISGIKKTCLDLNKKSYLIGGIEVVGTHAEYHLVDSRSQCYKTAVYIALLKVFESAYLIEI